MTSQLRTLAWVVSSFVWCCDGMRFLHDRTAYFPKINVNVSWSIIEETQSIYFEIIAPVTDENGWFAIGFSENSGMKGADIGLISLYHKKIYDLHSDDFILPEMDKIQDWKLESLTIKQDIGISIAQISRHLLTCDYQDFRIKTNPFHHYVLIAYNKYDDNLKSTTDMKLSINYHSYKETKEVNLFLNEDLLINDATSDFQSFYINNTNSGNSDFIEFLMNNGTIDVSKSGGTQYLCTMFNVTKDYKVTSVEIIDENGLNLVHHAELLHCDKSTLEEAGTQPIGWNTPAFECGTEDGVEMKCNLQFPLTASTTINLPSTMYYSLESGIYLLEVHYDLLDDYNAGNNFVFQDFESGIRIYTTTEDDNDDERENEVGILRLLVDENYNYYIPSGKKSYEVSFAVHSSCTNYYFPDNGIDIILIGGHMHYTGTKLRVDRIRYGDGKNGKNNEIVTIFELNHWDFDRQFAHRINYHLNKNDTLRIHCFYDTSDITTDTYFGWKTIDEMCQVYIGYTPKMKNLSTSLSKPVHTGILDSCYCGNLQLNGWDEVESLEPDPELFIFENTDTVGVNFIRNGLKTDKMDETAKYCEELVFTEVDLTRNKLIWRINQNYMSLFPGVLLFLSFYICFGIIEYCVIQRRLIDDIQKKDVEIRRKITLYIFSIIFYTIMLALLLASIPSDIMDLTENECHISYHERIDEDLTDNTYILAVSNCLIVFYICELYYRQKVKWDLFLHHFFTIMIILTLQTSLQYTLNVKTLFLIGYYYLLQIGTEQPLFFALVIRRLNIESIPDKWESWPFYFSSIWHYITKIGTTIVIVQIFAQSSMDCDIFYIYNVSYKEFLQKNNEPNWPQMAYIVLSCLIPLLFILQMYQGIVFWKIGNSQKIIRQLSQHNSASATSHPAAFAAQVDSVK